MRSLLLLVTLLCVANAVLVLPGMAPVNYGKGAEVKLKVNKLTSVHTQLPYGYYKLAKKEGLFCLPDTDPVEDSENIGEILTGDEIMSPSVYKVRDSFERNIWSKRVLSMTPSSIHYLNAKTFFLLVHETLSISRWKKQLLRRGTASLFCGFKI
jgi:hypothetical protein